ncbi:response regulator transcription factor [Methylicorpusculum oleiharenae]|uniref:response regulator transcription factor n=1 Tax=Methylicorpusculum oleiharenae TaxID=1338687 RepID=UPI00135AECB1|nr:response regulator transcription factor [Methylicorpusculum oleiharenae]MCD2452323.1 response regulator transcription factor [Methylicorpusculum oleiharenae]
MSENIPANANQSKAKIIIVDDHPIVRQGLAQVLNVQADMHLCCEASNAEEAMLAMENCHHDLAIVDISLQGTSGFSLITSILTHFPNLPILVMSMHEESLYAERSLKLGARGYVMKHRATIDIKTAIRQILAGELYVSDEIHRMILDRMSSNSYDQGNDDPTKSLTIREFEVLRLIGFGFGTRAISEKLSRSVKTIEAHRANIKQKLGLSTGIELLRFATLWIKKND